MDNDEISDQLHALQPLEQLIENAKKLGVWDVKLRGPIYKGTAESTLHNKRAYWRKAASDSKKITDMFPTKEDFELTIDHDNLDDLIFDDSSDNNNDDKFTLKSLDLLLKKKNDL